MPELWIIEKRDDNGALVFTAPQPEDIFGMGAIHGMTDHAMATVIHHYDSAVELDGRTIATWPTTIDPYFRARIKTW
jgi:hypothetical protein